jgi:hypothetical protein
MRFSLACALRKRTVDAEVVNEVMSDLDLQKLTWGLPSESPAVNAPYSGIPVMANSAVEPEIHREISSAAEAAAYMQQVALKLRNWRESLEEAPPSVADSTSNP